MTWESSSASVASEAVKDVGVTHLLRLAIRATGLDEVDPVALFGQTKSARGRARLGVSAHWSSCPLVQSEEVDRHGGAGTRKELGSK